MLCNDADRTVSRITSPVTILVTLFVDFVLSILRGSFENVYKLGDSGLRRSCRVKYSSVNMKLCTDSKQHH
jgi:hypothetical protein